MCGEIGRWIGASAMMILRQTQVFPRWYPMLDAVAMRKADGYPPRVTKPKKSGSFLLASSMTK
jgi:hypothetical protein